MNEKLKAILLELATDPLSLKAVQVSLVALSDAGLENWEKQLKNAVKRDQVKNISDVLKCFFTQIPPAKQDTVTRELLKPIILAHAKLPATQRPSDFYNGLNLYSNQYFGGKNGSWLRAILTELPANELKTIFDQTSSEEVYSLFSCFDDQQVLEGLPAEIFLFFLQKLSIETIKKLPLAEMVKNSETVWEALVNWFDQAAISPPAGFWELVKEKQIIKIDGFLEFLAIKSEATLSFSKFSIDNLHADAPVNHLRILIEAANLSKFSQSTLADHLLAYGLLAICIARNDLVLKEVRANTEDATNGEIIRHRLEELKTLKSRYESASPFLKLLSEAKIFPAAMIEVLKNQLNLPEQNVHEYLQIAGFLPRPSDETLTKSELKALTPKPSPKLKSKSSSTSSSSLFVSDDEEDKTEFSEAQQQEKADLALAEQLHLENHNHHPEDDDKENLLTNPNSSREQADFRLAQQLQTEEERQVRAQNQQRHTANTQSENRGTAQPNQPESFQLKPAITISVAIVLSLILALSLCFSAVAAPLWIIPVTIIASIYAAVVFTVVFNHINNRSHPTPPPSGSGNAAEGEPYLHNNFRQPQTRNSALGFSQEEFWQAEQSNPNGIAFGLENNNDNDYDNMNFNQ